MMVSHVDHHVHNDKQGQCDDCWHGTSAGRVLAYICMCCDFKSHLGQLFFPWKRVALGVIVSTFAFDIVLLVQKNSICLCTTLYSKQLLDCQQCRDTQTGMEPVFF